MAEYPPQQQPGFSYPPTFSTVGTSYTPDQQDAPLSDASWTMDANAHPTFLSLQADVQKLEQELDSAQEKIREHEATIVHLATMNRQSFSRKTLHGLICPVCGQKIAHTCTTTTSTGTQPNVGSSSRPWYQSSSTPSSSSRTIARPSGHVPHPVVISPSSLQPRLGNQSDIHSLNTSNLRLPTLDIPALSWPQSTNLATPSRLSPLSLNSSVPIHTQQSSDSGLMKRDRGRTSLKPERKRARPNVPVSDEEQGDTNVSSQPLARPQFAATSLAPEAISSPSASEDLSTTSEGVSEDESNESDGLESHPGWSVRYNTEVERALDVRLAHILEHARSVRCVRFSRDGKYLGVGCSGDGLACIYNVRTGKKTCDLKDTLHGKDISICDVCFSPNGRYLATGGSDGLVRIWEISKRSVRNAFKGHTWTITSLDFSPNGRLLASGSVDKTVRIWNMHDGLIKGVYTSDARIATIRFRKDGRYVAAGILDRGEVLIWDVATGQSVKLIGDRVNNSRVAFTPDGNGLVCSNYSIRMIIKYWDVGSLGLDGRGEGNLESNDEMGLAKEILKFEGRSSYYISTVSVSHDGRWVLSGSHYTPRIWDTKDGKWQCMLLGHGDFIKSVRFSPVGGFLASGGQDCHVRIWRYTKAS